MYSHVLGFSLVCILVVLHWSVLSCARFSFVCILAVLWLYSHVLGFSLVLSCILAVLHGLYSCSVFFRLYSRGSLVCTLMCSSVFRGSLVCTLMCSVFLYSVFSRFFIGLYFHVLGISLVCILAVLWSVLSCARFFVSIYFRGSLVCTLMCSVFL